MSIKYTNVQEGIPAFDIAQGQNPETPKAGFGSIVFGTDGKVYKVLEDGTISQIEGVVAERAVIAAMQTNSQNKQIVPNQWQNITEGLETGTTGISPKGGLDYDPARGVVINNSQNGYEVEVTFTFSGNILAGSATDYISVYFGIITTHAGGIPQIYQQHMFRKMLDISNCDTAIASGFTRLAPGDSIWAVVKVDDPLGARIAQDRYRSIVVKQL